THEVFLTGIVAALREAGIRTSIFVGADAQSIEHAAKTGVDRVELYTEPYAIGYASDPVAAVAPFAEAAQLARQLGLGLNAGHDLNLNNLAFLCRQIPCLEEVSIGHALVCDALYLGLQKTIEAYKNELI
ncbi:MAG: pyridoxine 5'-phosphate synthase, partial [Bacteroidales bacterium]|nr:pyridoxine 5'-phosphate synthase [Bacteroidales bacterium]